MKTKEEVLDNVGKLIVEKKIQYTKAEARLTKLMEQLEELNELYEHLKKEH